MTQRQEDMILAIGRSEYNAVNGGKIVQPSDSVTWLETLFAYTDQQWETLNALSEGGFVIYDANHRLHKNHTVQLTQMGIDFLNEIIVGKMRITKQEEIDALSAIYNRNSYLKDALEIEQFQQIVENIRNDHNLFLGVFNTPLESVIDADETVRLNADLTALQARVEYLDKSLKQMESEAAGNDAKITHLYNVLLAINAATSLIKSHGDNPTTASVELCKTFLQLPLHQQVESKSAVDFIVESAWEVT